MNKSQLIEAVAKEMAMPKNEVKKIVESLFKISVDKIAPRRTVRFRSRIDVDSGYEAAGDELEA